MPDSFCYTDMASYTPRSCSGDRPRLRFPGHRAFLGFVPFVSESHALMTHFHTPVTFTSTPTAQHYTLQPCSAFDTPKETAWQQTNNSTHSPQALLPTSTIICCSSMRLRANSGATGHNFSHTHSFTHTHIMCLAPLKRPS